MAKARGGGNGHSRIIGLAFLLILLASFGYSTSPVSAGSTNTLAGVTQQMKASPASDENRIAIVKPIFSATAYTNAFYVFYSRYMSLPWGQYVTTDLNLLNRTIVPKWGWSENLAGWFGTDAARSLHLVLNETVIVVDEIQVDQGALFDNGVRKYDVLILGFTEYVTQREYLYYKQFVESGGTLILMDACNFYAEVKYSNGYLSLVKGHGWEFNGTHAWRLVDHRWPDENRNWIGSNYWRYWWGKHYNAFMVNTTNALSDYIRSALGENISTSYGGHEENRLENFTGTEVIGYWNFVNQSECTGNPVAAYVHRYGRGMVIHSGIMASDIMLSDKFMGVFLAVCLRYALTGDVAQWEYPEPLVLSDDLVQSSVAMHEADGALSAGPLSGLAYCEINFSATKGVFRQCHRCDLNSVKGMLDEETGQGQQLQPSTVFKGRNVSNSCWRLDVNTFLFPNENYRLTINVTWKGEHYPLLDNESMASVNFTVMNDWWISIFPWAAPLGAGLFTVVIIMAYMRVNGAKSRKSPVLSWEPQL